MARQGLARLGEAGLGKAQNDFEGGVSERAGIIDGEPGNW